MDETSHTALGAGQDPAVIDDAGEIARILQEHVEEVDYEDHSAEEIELARRSNTALPFSTRTSRNSSNIFSGSSDDDEDDFMIALSQTHPQLAAYTPVTGSLNTLPPPTPSDPKQPKPAVLLIYCGTESSSPRALRPSSTCPPCDIDGSAGCGRLISIRGKEMADRRKYMLLHGQEGMTLVDDATVAIDIPPFDSRCGDLRNDQDPGMNVLGCSSRRCRTKDIGCKNCGNMLGHRMIHECAACRMRRGVDSLFTYFLRHSAITTRLRSQKGSPPLSLVKSVPLDPTSTLRKMLWLDAPPALIFAKGSSGYDLNREEAGSLIDVGGQGRRRAWLASTGNAWWNNYGGGNPSSVAASPPTRPARRFGDQPRGGRVSTSIVTAPTDAQLDLLNYLNNLEQSTTAAALRSSNIDRRSLPVSLSEDATVESDPARPWRMLSLFLQPESPASHSHGTRRRREDGDEDDEGHEAGAAADGSLRRVRARVSHDAR